jgi:Fe2+ or Zn2+ uptake regulation protein
MEKIEKFKNELNQSKIKPSLIRLKVLEYLRNTRTHPDVEQIYKELVKIIPTLSKTSIYNALRLFVKNGLVKEILIENEEVRYDGIKERHAHLKCVECKKLIDIDLNCKSCKNAIKNKNIDIFDEHIYFVGLCEECKKKG